MAAPATNGMRQTPLTCHGHTRPVVHLAFSGVTENGCLLISACKDGKPMLRQGETGDWIGTFEGHKGAVWGCALSRDGKKAATGAADFCAKIWDTESGDETYTLSHSHIVRSVDFSSDNNFLLTGSNEKLVKVFDLNAPEAGAVVVGKGHTQAVRHALFAHNDEWIISTSDDKTVRFWERSTGQEIKRIELPSIPTSIEISAAGQILSVSCGRTVSFWNVDSMEKVKEYSTAAQVLSSTLHPDMTVFVCGGDDFKMYKYDYDNGSEKDSFKGHFGPVHCVRFSPDGELYASGSEDGTVRLWQNVVGKNYGLWKCVMPDEAVPVAGDEATGDTNNKH